MTPDFLAFIARSPVTEMIDRFTEGLQAQGSGRLALKLLLPLGQLAQTKVSGVYTFGNNNVRNNTGGNTLLASVGQQ